MKREPGKRRPTPARGYAAPPGTGPAGETCGSCRFRVVHSYSRDYHKCSMFVRIGGRWTSGTSTDIRVRSAACKFWEKA
jgi:hypothetical protein